MPTRPILLVNNESGQAVLKRLLQLHEKMPEVFYGKRDAGSIL